MMQTTKPRPPAAQAGLKAKIDEARQQARAQQDDQRARRLAGTTPGDRSVGRVLLSAEDLWAMGIHYSRVQLWKMVKAGLFPQPIKISSNRNAWIQHEILEWIDARASERTPDEAA